MKIALPNMLMATAVLLLLSCEPHEEAPYIELNQFQSIALNYFGEVALGFESGNVSEITRRWQGDIKLFVGGSYNERQLTELKSVISELNDLIAPTAEITVVQNQSQSDAYFHFGSAASYLALFPELSEALKGNGGYFNVWFEQDVIVASRIFVNTELLNFEQQKSLIREELAQSLGLGNDSPLYPNSVFYETANNGGFATSFADLDREVIRLLYHPQMQIGLNHSEANATIRAIYDSEASH